MKYKFIKTFTKDFFTSFFIAIAIYFVVTMLPISADGKVYVAAVFGITLATIKMRLKYYLILKRNNIPIKGECGGPELSKEFLDSLPKIENEVVTIEIGFVKGGDKWTWQCFKYFNKDGFLKVHNIDGEIDNYPIEQIAFVTEKAKEK